MADSKHTIPSPTPGPWRAQCSGGGYPQWDVFGANDQHVAAFDGGDEHAEADAALIAAAPALRDALLTLSDGSNCWCPWHSLDDYHTRRCRQARAALAAASTPDAQTEVGR